MKDVYITSTLRHEWNVSFNAKLCAALEAEDLACYLPQRDTDQGGDAIAEADISGIKQARKLLAVAENESVNWGAEVGYAHGTGKQIVGLQKEGHEIPLIAKAMLTHVITVADLDNVESYLYELIGAINE